MTRSCGRPLDFTIRAVPRRLNHVPDGGRTNRTSRSDRPEAISRSWCRCHGESPETACLNHICRDASYCHGYQLWLGNLGFWKFSVNIYSNRVRACRLSALDLLANSNSDNVEVELVGNGSGRVGGSGAVGQEACGGFLLCRG